MGKETGNRRKKNIPRLLREKKTSMRSRLDREKKKMTKKKKQ